VILLAIPILLVAVLVLAPPLLPRDPRERVLREYFAAIGAGDRERAARFGVVDDAPIVRSLADARWLEGQERVIEGSFRPIADFHALIDQTYRREGDVFIRKDTTRTLAKVINAADAMRQAPAAPADSLDQATAQLEKLEQSLGIDDSASSPPRRPPRDELDRAIDFAEQYSKAMESIQRLLIRGPKHAALAATYEQLAAEEKDRFDDSQKQLLDDVGANRGKWRQALGREFLDLRDGGQFTFEKSTWEARAWLPNQSTSEPPRVLCAQLIRFRLGLIDSGWKVWEIRAAD
jgi:hypothetical protein